MGRGGDESRPPWNLTFRASWALSERVGWVRTVQLSADPAGGDATFDIEVLDGLVDVVPSGIVVLTEQGRSNLVDAYKRAEIGEWGSLAVYSPESLISDRAEPLEALTATAVWSTGFADAEILLDADAVDELFARLRSAGHTVAPMNHSTGRSTDDGHVARRPYTPPALKISR